MNITIVGMGYVGLPLAMRFCGAGHKVIGVDVSSKVLETLRRVQSPIADVPSVLIRDHTYSQKFRSAVPTEELPPQDAFIICVPTPLNANREPDMRHVISAAEWVGPKLLFGAIVSLESSTYPGTTSGLVREILEKTSGLTAGKDFSLVFSPERLDPGNGRDIGSVPKLVGGFTKDCAREGEILYGSAFESVVVVDSCEIAEAAKLTENIFRFVNIALVNELKLVYREMGIDIWKVLDAAETKPYGFMRFDPGPGVGGHCIPVDPYYLTWKARESGATTRMIELAGHINEGMPENVVGRVAYALNAKGKSVMGATILIVGVAYKKNVADIRESPSLKIMEDLIHLGAQLDYADGLVPVIQTHGKHPLLDGMGELSRYPKTKSSYDCIVILTAHTGVRLDSLDGVTDTVVDTRNVVSEKPGLTVFKG